MTPNDPLYGLQWHFQDDLIGDIEAIWDEYSGAGVQVGVYDGFVDTTHPDYVGNYDATLHFRDSSGEEYNPKPGPNDTNYLAAHGTNVAGLIAAEANNGEGGTGVAHGATLTGVNWVDDIQYKDIGTRIEALEWAQNFDVMNNSWGATPLYRDWQSLAEEASLRSQYNAAYGTVVDEGRGGLGTVIVQAAGNDRLNANGDGLNASRYTITVAATDSGGDVMSYSNFGSSILVAAPAASVTTDLQGSDGLNDDPTLPDLPPDLPNQDYTQNFGGTSAATPVVSGVAALMLEANPNLGWRDVQNILAISAAQTGSDYGSDGTGHEVGSWFANGATNWNGGGMSFHQSYGFGMVDAYAAVRMAEVWGVMHGDAATSENERKDVSVSYDGGPIPLIDGVNGFVPLTVEENIRVEDIYVTVDMSHVQGDTIALGLRAPTGEVFTLMFTEGDGFLMDGGFKWTFGVTGALGVMSAGEWQLIVLDTVGDDKKTGVLTDVTIDFFGSDFTADDVYHFTQDLFAMVAEESGRQTITDTNGGTDWLNFAAMGTAAITADLSAGTVAFAGESTTLSIDEDAQIENVMAGDGNDTLTGNSADNELHGMRGNDTLTGAGGNDTLRGGAGNDFVQGGAGNDTIWWDNADRSWVEGGAQDIGGAGYDTLQVETGSWFRTSNLDNYGFEAFVGAEHSDSVIGFRDDVGYDFAGGAGNDTLTGAGGNDTLRGGAGNDTLRGGGGNDFVQGGAGNDTIWWDNADRSWVEGGAQDIGGAGYDTLQVETGSWFRTSNLDNYGFEAFVGAEHSDSVIGFRDDVGYDFAGGAGNDTLTGAGGNDTLRGGAGNDFVQGGAGNDTIWWDNADRSWVEGGAQDIGGAGYDTLQVETGSWFRTSNLDNYGFEAFVGAEHSDSVIGFRDDVGYDFAGGAGNDTLTGAGGNDTLRGGAGNDFVQGGAGNDTIWWDNADRSWVEGGAQDIGGAGYDTLQVETGSWFRTSNLDNYGFEAFVGAEHSDSVIGFRDDVGYDFAGGAGDDTLTGAGGNDTLRGGAGNDTLTGGAGNDFVQGGAGNDTIWWDNADRSWVEGGAQDIGGAGYDTLQVETGSWFRTSNLDNYGFEAFVGAEHSDSVIGFRDDVGYDFAGGAGNDTLTGAGGNDTLRGGAGNDFVQGGAGNDTIWWDNADRSWVEGGAQDIGGAGYDTLQVETGSWFRTSNLDNYGFEAFVGAEHSDSVIGFRDDVGYDFAGGAGNDTLTGAGGNDTLRGGAGNDFVQGGAGNDTIWWDNADRSWVEGGAQDIGGAGYDTLQVETGSWFRTSNLDNYGFEAFVGAEHSDSVIGFRDDVGYDFAGGAGDDTLTGAGGNDTLRGGAGNDTLTGGAGADTFVFAAGDDADIITDFETGIDTLDLTSFGFDSAAEALGLAFDTAEGVVFDFGNGDVLTLRDVTKSQLGDDLLA
jgi:Ca2+-binding RTX toxin-like protein/subtilisin-like proprotein convertase family protein